MALRWTAAGVMEAAKGFRRLKAYKHLPLLRVALAAHQSIPRQMFQEILRLIAELPPQPPAAPA
jgi:hypothetical protein